MDSKNLDFDFARAWDLNQGNFAHGLAEKILNYANENNISTKTLLDICCGASNLIGYFENKGTSCTGTETRQGMYEYSKSKHEQSTYYLTEKIYEIPGKNKYDIITCTHDIINYMESFDEWIQLFKNANKHLNKNGVFFFDFYTKNKLQNWNETTFSSSEYLDFVMTVKSGLYDKTSISYTYYINYDNYHVKTRDLMVECYYETQMVIDALKKFGFKNVQVVDADLNPIEYFDNMERIYIIAKHK